MAFKLALGFVGLFGLLSCDSNLANNTENKVELENKEYYAYPSCIDTQLSTNFLNQDIIKIIGKYKNFKRSEAKLWKVTFGNKISYILGTLHYSPSRLKIDDIIYEHIKNSRLFINEASNLKIKQSYRLLDNPSIDNPKIKNVLHTNQFRNVHSVLERFGIDKNKANEMSLLSVEKILYVLIHPCDMTGEGNLDQHLEAFAIENNVPVEGLENFEDQKNSILFHRPITERIDNLLLYSKYIDQIYNLLRNDWSDGNLKRPINLIYAIGGESYKKIITRENAIRHRKMIKKIAPEMRKGRVFVAVGAQHIIGEDGLIEKLHQLGFDVSPVL